MKNRGIFFYSIIVVGFVFYQTTITAQETANREGVAVASLSREERLLRSASSQSEGVQVEWAAHYAKGEGNHVAVKLTVDKSGNIYVAGKYDISGRMGDDFDYLILKYNNAGIEQWNTTYVCPGQEEPTAIAVDNSSNVYIHGRCLLSYYDYLTIKYNSSGAQQWLNRYDGPSQTTDLGTGMALDAFGNVYTTGRSKGLTYPVVGSDFDFATIKYNAAGVQQWVARYDGSQRGGTVQIISDDNGNYVAVDKDGKVHVTGTTGNNICTIKYNAQGVQEWVTSYTGPGFSEDSPVGIALDASGNVYVAGTTQGYGTGKDIVAIKYNSSGVEQWISRYSGPSDDDAYDMIVDASENLYVCGTSRVSNKSNLVTVKFSTSGTQAWYALYDPIASYATVGKALATDATGNIYVTGYSQMQASSYDYVTIKYSAGGQQQWAIHYDNNKGFEMAQDIGIDGNGGVIVTGYEVSGNGNQITTIKYSQPSVSIEEGDANEPAQLRLAQNYPNPFNPTTVVSYQLPEAGIVKLVVVDMLGREVSVLVNERRETGVHDVRFDALGLSSGVYYYRLQAGDLVATKRMVLVK